MSADCYVNQYFQLFIKLCVKLKHIHLASYVGVEKLSAKVNVVLLWYAYIMSKISLKLCKFSTWNSLNLDLWKIFKSREHESQNVRESQGTLLNKLGGNPVIEVWYISQWPYTRFKTWVKLEVFAKVYFDEVWRSYFPFMEICTI